MKCGKKSKCQRRTFTSLPLSQYAHLTLLSNYSLKFSYSVFAHNSHLASSLTLSLPPFPLIPHSPLPVPPLRLISGTCFFCNIVTISFSVRPQFRTWYRSLLLLLFLLSYFCFIVVVLVAAAAAYYVWLARFVVFSLCEASPPQPCALATICFCVKCLICLSSAERMQPLRKYVQPVSQTAAPSPLPSLYPLPNPIHSLFAYRFLILRIFC